MELVCQVESARWVELTLPSYAFVLGKAVGRPLFPCSNYTEKNVFVKRKKSFFSLFTSNLWQNSVHISYRFF